MERAAIVRDAATGEAVVVGTGVTVAEILRELASGPGVEVLLRRRPERRWRPRSPSRPRPGSARPGTTLGG